MEQFRQKSKKVLVGIVGGLVVIIGLAMIPYPGPGWLVVFGGLAILATEFERARKILHYVRGKYDAWVLWIKRRPWFVKAPVLLITTVVVITTVWLLNGFGFLRVYLLPLIGIGEDWAWMDSPWF